MMVYSAMAEMCPLIEIWQIPFPPQWQLANDSFPFNQIKKEQAPLISLRQQTFAEL